MVTQRTDGRSECDWLPWIARCDMAMSVTKTDVWATEIADRPGAVSSKLQSLASAGVNLEFLLARRQPDKPGMGIVYVSGIKGAKAAKAAATGGFQKSTQIVALRVDATNKPGACHEVLRRIAAAGINIRGATAMGIGTKCSTFVAFDSAADADAAAKLLRKGGRK